MVSMHWRSSNTRSCTAGSGCASKRLTSSSRRFTAAATPAGNSSSAAFSVMLSWLIRVRRGARFRSGVARAGFTDVVRVLAPAAGPTLVVRRTSEVTEFVLEAATTLGYADGGQLIARIIAAQIAVPDEVA